MLHTVDVQRGHGWDLLTGDTLVSSRTCILYGLVMRVSTAGGDVTLYAGKDATSGRKIGTFVAPANTSISVPLDSLRAEGGVYVDFGSNVTDVLLIYDPVPEGEGIVEVQSG